MGMYGVEEEFWVGEYHEDCLSTFPLICLTQFSRPGESYREPFCQHCQMRSHCARAFRER